MKANYKFRYFLIVKLIIIPFIFCQITDDINFQTSIIESENSYLIDINDYHNLNLIITTAKNIYSISNLTTPKSQISLNINNISMAATYDENYILVACSDDNLLSKININTGDFEKLLDYNEISNMEDTDILAKPDQSCSLSIDENIAYITISIAYIDDETTTAYNKFFLIKINLQDSDNGPEISSQSFFKFPESYKKTSFLRQLSCETIKIKNTDDKRVVCTYEKYSGTNNYIIAQAIKSDLSAFEGKELSVAKYSYESGFQCYKNDIYVISCTMRKYLYNINLIYDSDNKIKLEKVLYLNILEATNNLYYYSNDFVISARTETIIKNNSNLNLFYIQINTNSDTYYRLYDYSALSANGIVKIISYFIENDNILYVIYHSEDKIKYFSMSGNIKNIFNMESYSKTYKIVSNYEDSIVLDDEFIEAANTYGSIEIQNTIEYQTNSKNTYKYLMNKEDSTFFPYNKTTYTLQPPQTNNYWYVYNFAYIDNDDNYLRILYFNNINITIETCTYQCESCTSDYYSCDSCRNDSYSKLIDSTDDNNCYPIDQIIDGYKYNSDTKNFEKCYFSCKFCSESVNVNPSSEHKCLVCSDGFYPSYQYLGNCYKMNENEINSEKYVESETDESFTLKSCSEAGKSYKIFSTGECVDQCPTSTPYYSYTYKYINFTYQTNEKITDQQYVLSLKEEFPHYSFNKICYENCPTNTEIDTSNNDECKCINAWHQDISTNEIVCYEVNYCISSDYKYYYDDTKECKQNGNTEEYYQFNFHCYKDGCPENTIENPTDSHICESTYSFCYINEYFQNVCSDTKNEEYIYQFDNTKQYLKLCSDSLIYTTVGSKTYLYNNICYLTCPTDITNTDEDNDKCTCKYYGYYTDNENYICYEENEKCNDKGKIPVIDLLKCVDTIDECTNNGYKIFNNECYSQNCPELTKINENNNNECICKFSYYNDNNILNCFEQEECDSGYSYSNPNTLECFTSLDDCFSKDNQLFYDMECYKDSCPSGKIPFNSITNEEIKNALISELSLENELMNKLCVCDSEKNWNKTNNNGEILQICVDDCGEEYEPDQLTRKCKEKCLPSKHYVFNDICYLEGCPEGSQLNESNPDSRICVCEKSSYIENNIIICCDELAGTCPALNLSNCPTDYKIYKYNCYSKCPEKTCLIQSDPNLKTCINITASMTVIGGICFENLDDIIDSLKSNEGEISPISNLKDATISGYFIYDEVYKSSVDSNYSLLYLNDCEDKLKKVYHLDSDEKLLIIQIESINKEKKSAINNYNYGIFLENGTQLDVSKCEGEKVTLSSPIVDTESIQLDKAIYFSEMNYDIYDENSDFYTDICAPASISGNDITLSDRKTDFYPSDVSLCNNNCGYNSVNLTTKRVICDCDIISENDEESDTDTEEKKEDNSSYIDYFLSLINYKITKCFNLITDINNYKFNLGSYFGAAIFLACFSLMFVFIFKGMMIINIYILKGIPTKSKLLERRKESIDKKNQSESKENLKEDKKKLVQPPKKNKKVKTENHLEEEEEEKDFNEILRTFKINNLNKNEEKIIQTEKVSKSTKDTKNAKSIKNSKKSKNIKNSKNSKNAKNSKNSRNSICVTGNKLSGFNKEPKSKFFPKNINIKSKNKSSKRPSFQINNIVKTNKIETNNKDDNYMKKKSGFSKNCNLIGFKNITDREKEILKNNFKRLIAIDDDVDKNELNNIPFSQALRLENRNFFQIFISIIANKIEIISIFYYRNELMHLSLSISIYLFSLLLDLTLNCFLYSDDVVSEKYHNDGTLNFFTSFALSLFSNIFSAIIVYVIAKLTEFSEFLELMVSEISNVKQYYYFSFKFKKITKLKLTCFFVIQFIFNIVMFYYLSIFCIVYKNSQTSILLNYLLGIAQSLGISFGTTLIITIIRLLGIKYKWEYIYNTSKYFYETF